MGDYLQERSKVNHAADRWLLTRLLFGRWSMNTSEASSAIESSAMETTRSIEPKRKMTRSIERKRKRESDRIKRRRIRRNGKIISERKKKWNKKAEK